MHSYMNSDRYHHVLCDEEFETTNMTLLSHHSRRYLEPVCAMEKHALVCVYAGAHTHACVHVHVHTHTHTHTHTHIYIYIYTYVHMHT